jgi:hypothetical protein
MYLFHLCKTLKEFSNFLDLKNKLTNFFKKMAFWMCHKKYQKKSTLHFAQTKMAGVETVHVETWVLEHVETLIYIRWVWRILFISCCYEQLSFFGF